MLTNTIVNDTGASWISDMLLQTGGNTVDILRSHLYASKIIEMNHVKEKLFEIEANLDPTIEYLIRMQIEHALNRTCLWLMRNETMPQKDSFEQNVKFLHENLSTLLPQEDEEHRAASSLDLVGASVPEDLATPLSKLEYVDEILDIAEVLSKVETNIELASKLYFIAGAQSGLLEFIRGATQSYNTSRLEKPARTALRGQLRSALVNATALILQSGQMPENLNSQTLESFQKVARDLSPLSNGRFDLSSLVLAVDRSQHNLVLYQSSQKL